MSEQEGTWSTVVLKTASCVVGDDVIVLPDDVTPGDIIECHGVTQRVTYEYGAYALEKLWRCGMWKYRTRSLGFLEW